MHPTKTRGSKRPRCTRNPNMPKCYPRLACIMGGCFHEPWTDEALDGRSPRHTKDVDETRPRRTKDFGRNLAPKPCPKPRPKPRPNFYNRKQSWQMLGKFWAWFWARLFGQHVSVLGEVLGEALGSRFAASFSKYGSQFWRPVWAWFWARIWAIRPRNRRKDPIARDQGQPPQLPGTREVQVPRGTWELSAREPWNP